MCFDGEVEAIAEADPHPFENREEATSVSQARRAEECPMAVQQSIEVLANMEIEPGMIGLGGVEE
jgi:hypothetical protein